MHAKGISMGTTAFLVSIREASRAFNVTRDLLYRLIHQGQIPFYRLSPRTLRVDLSELREHLKLITQKGHETEGRGAGGAKRRRRAAQPRRGVQLNDYARSFEFIE